MASAQTSCTHFDEAKVGGRGCQVGQSGKGRPRPKQFGSLFRPHLAAPPPSLVTGLPSFPPPPPPSASGLVERGMKGAGGRGKGKEGERERNNVFPPSPLHSPPSPGHLRVGSQGEKEEEEEGRAEKKKETQSKRRTLSWLLLTCPAKAAAGPQSQTNFRPE